MSRNSPNFCLRKTRRYLALDRPASQNNDRRERQVSRDLLGIDSSGDLVIVELKKGKTPREVVAQALDYATWAAGLTYDELNAIACLYFKTSNYSDSSDLRQAYKDVFYPDAEEEVNVEFNRNQKIFIVAEEVTPTVRDVTSHLRSKYGMKIVCIEYKVYRSEQGEYIISTEKIGNYDKAGAPSPARTKPSDPTTRWNQPIRIKDVVCNAVKAITEGRAYAEFMLVDVYNELIKQYPDIKRTSLNCQIYADLSIILVANIIRRASRICITVSVWADTTGTTTVRMVNGHGKANRLLHHK